MTCPLCGDDCRCAEPRAFVSGPEWVDPEAADDSEEQFAASLQASAPSLPRYPRIIMPEPELSAAATQHYTDNPPVDDEEPQFASAAQGRFALPPQAESSPANDPDFWREEVANRLQNYRAKRRRRLADAHSMELDFNTPPSAAMHSTPAVLRPRAAAQTAAPDQAQSMGDIADQTFPAMADSEGAYSLVLEPAATTQAIVHWDGTVERPAPLAAPAADIPPQLETARLPEVWNVIQFPAPPLQEFPRGDELADPVVQIPRILDAPEMVEQVIPTQLTEISLETEEDPAHLLDEIEVPLPVAPLPQRVFGGMADLLLVLAAMGMFGYIVLKICGAIPFSKTALALGLAVPCIFWILFQYVFLVYGAATPGMKLAGVALADFEGDPVRRQTRRSRVLAMALSSISLGLGFIWALVDEDGLCWHDRITRTFPRQLA